MTDRADLEQQLAERMARAEQYRLRAEVVPRQLQRAIEVLRERLGSAAVHGPRLRCGDLTRCDTWMCPACEPCEPPDEPSGKG